MVAIEQWRAYGEKSVPGVTIPEVLIERVTKAKNPAEEGIRICVERIE